MTVTFGLAMEVKGDKGFDFGFLGYCPKLQKKVRFRNLYFLFLFIEKPI